MRLHNAEDIVVHLGLKCDNIRVITPDMSVKVVNSYFKAEDGTLMFRLSSGETFSYKQLGYYNPIVDGAINAVRIFNKDGYQPMATLTFAFGGTFTFEWDRCDIRELMEPGITAYTIFYDTRAERPFTDWIKTADDPSFSWPELNSEDVNTSF